ncbi:MAG TPA: MFS transporter, partial [Vicinamibacterales bacterium]|nr:MFS transporter [Vicinamibacterales bacterium]
MPRVFSGARFARALRHRNYRLFFSGQLISLIGSWMQSVAESWLVYRLTGSAALLGVAGFASQIPVLFLATFGGTVADRYNRHRIIVITQTTSMILPLILAALVFTGRVHVWHVLALAATLGVVNAFDVPARQAFVIEMVGKDDLVNAIALNSS